MCMHIAEKLGVEGAKKHGLTDRMEFRKKSNDQLVEYSLRLHMSRLEDPL